MAHSYDELRRRYADALWLKSELTIIEMYHNNFDPRPNPLYGYGPDPLRLPKPQEYKITVHAMSGKPYTIYTHKEVDFALFDTGETLAIFATYFGDSVVDFAVMSKRLEKTQRPAPARVLSRRTEDPIASPPHNSSI